jgi:hypothetical protein
VDQIPSTIGGLLTWLVGSAGIGFMLTWLGGLAFWTIQDSDVKIVRWIKSSKDLVVALVTAVLGVAASLGTTYIPSGVLENFDPYYKIIWTVLIEITTKSAGDYVALRVNVAKLTLRVNAMRALNLSEAGFAAALRNKAIKPGTNG